MAPHVPTMIFDQLIKRCVKCEFNCHDIWSTCHISALDSLKKIKHLTEDNIFIYR